MEEKDILLSPQMLERIAKQLGYSGSIPPQFVELASTLLMGGMAKNANSDQATDVMLKDIEEDEEGRSILDQLEKDGQEPDLNAAEKKGGILDNLLGDKLDPLAQAFAEATGLPKDKAKQLMMILAPILLAMVAQKVSANNGSGKEGLKDVVKKTYKNPSKSREEYQLEQQKMQIEQQKHQLEMQKAELEKRQQELSQKQKELEKRRSTAKRTSRRDGGKYQIPNKKDEGLLEKLLDRDGDGSFMDEAVTLLKQLLLR